MFSGKNIQQIEDTLYQAITQKDFPLSSLQKIWAQAKSAGVNFSQRDLIAAAREFHMDKAQFVIDCLPHSRMQALDAALIQVAADDFFQRSEARELYLDIKREKVLSEANKLKIEKHCKEVIDMARLLLKNGANILATKEGMDVLYFAKKARHLEAVVNFLEEVKTNPNLLLAPVPPASCSVSLGLNLFSPPQNAVSPQPVRMEDQDVYAIPIHKDYRRFLKEYLQTLNGKKTNKSRLPNEILASVDEDNTLCSEKSMSVPNIPVRLNGHIYSLEELEELFQPNEDTAQIPYLNDASKVFGREDIEQARDIQSRIDEAITAATRKAPNLSKM